MSQPIALGRPLPPLPPDPVNVLSAPTSPSRSLPRVDKTKVDPAIRRAAEGMEAMFLDYLMKTMRQTIPKNEMDLESPATEIYRSMLDTETAQKAARVGGIGLADQIIAYLEAQRYTLPKGHDAPVSTGGTHAGQPAE